MLVMIVWLVGRGHIQQYFNYIVTVRYVSNEHIVLYASGSEYHLNHMFKC